MNGAAWPAVLNPANLVFPKDWTKSVAAQGLISMSALRAQCHGTNTLTVTFTYLRILILVSLYQKERRLVFITLITSNLKSLCCSIYHSCRFFSDIFANVV